MKLLHLIRKHSPNYTILKETHLKHEVAEKLKVRCGKNVSENNNRKKKLAKLYLDRINRLKVKYNFFYAKRGFDFLPSYKSFAYSGACHDSESARTS